MIDLRRVFLVAAAALPVACAAVATGPDPAPAGRNAPPAAPPPSPQAMLELARIAGALELPVEPGFVDRMVRWQLELRDRMHVLEQGVESMIERVQVSVPDLTVLATEPVAHTESSGFGWRDDPIRHTRSFHSGTDFRGQPGTQVVAAGNGVVAFCGRMGGYGNLISIDHGGGVITRYAHLRRITTKKDTAIIAGQPIGEVGSTGRTTGPHLHFEVRIDGAPVSPIAAMAIAQLQRDSPLVGRLAALSLAPELQAAAESDVDPPKQRKPQRTEQRPERVGRAKRPQVLW